MIHYKTRPATKADAATAFDLINELAEYEKAPHEVKLSLPQFIEDGFGANPIYKLHVAEAFDTDQQQPTPKIVGIALYYIAYSTWKGKIVYLDDLIVTQTHRKTGIGNLLINEVFKFALSINAQQVRWHVLEWNEPAINFYKKLGVHLDPEWITCKVTETKLAEIRTKLEQNIH
ncbi:MAG: GNAT family N-acetyltransferase [Sphingobacteriales bacterium]|jgi:GNAT superfamily N-acetyltransferase|nr:GNAT family N-acetyltransferase [Sphingobacteriales bacterium]MBP9141811.1 GNAT family N-acetyltransferase [Chitinophagales bacterium]MDA0198185.1 GNAT family N-acetyltransferase [Bacteroidota bacterium]MBK7527987.1 GNAT family N-acetyltransferase [Sphingobacteriales bacterium]MBK8678976.1 GNAT family N-acetyltransferase [Sphingobacteriales bacterium]